MNTIFAVTFSYFIFLTVLAWQLNDATSAELFSETGFFEKFSLVAWLSTGITLLFRYAKTHPQSSIAISILCFLCAAREEDWHKKFTADGILKIKYYTQSAAPWTEKLPAALVAILFLSLIFYATYLAYHSWRNDSWQNNSAVQLTLFGISMFFIGKILDRSSSLLQEHLDIDLPTSVGRFIGAYEEGFEMWGPLLFAIAAMWPKPLSAEMQTI